MILSTFSTWRYGFSHSQGYLFEMIPRIINRIIKWMCKIRILPMKTNLRQRQKVVSFELFNAILVCASNLWIHIILSQDWEVKIKSNNRNRSIHKNGTLPGLLVSCCEKESLHNHNRRSMYLISKRSMYLIIPVTIPLSVLVHTR